MLLLNHIKYLHCHSTTHAHLKTNLPKRRRATIRAGHLLDQLNDFNARETPVDDDAVKMPTRT
eukprot:scaffold15199_cov193-Alexandrium_tamarense.AAC.15